MIGMRVKAEWPVMTVSRFMKTGRADSITRSLTMRDTARM